VKKEGCILLRQFVCFNLNEKLDIIPQFLTIIEKKWLIFQLLCGLEQIHSAGMVHGDIKSDNILVTSYDWLFIADMHRYKPVVVMDDDLKHYNMYFGDLNNN
jgi:phosphoinositide-3-kinase regulatory subunit 4